VYGLNTPGFLIFFLAFLTAIEVGELTGKRSSAAATALGGAIVVGVDLLYRRFWARCRLWEVGGNGGTFLWLPIWAFGLLWVAIGAARSIRNHG
jgi:hypothetical protein